MNKTLSSIPILLLAQAACLHAAPELAPVFQDHMVVQRDAPFTVWGSADPHSTVDIIWQGQSQKTQSTAEGQWCVTFPAAAQSSSPQTLIARDSEGEGETRVSDILIGDVWIASGQSNMAYMMRQFRDASRDAAQFDIPQLRLMSIRTPLHTSGGSYSLDQYRAWLKQGYVTLDWQTCTPASAKNFSATAAYFGRALQREQGIPIGIICNAVGGVGMESWISQASIEKLPALRSLSGDKWLQASPKEFSPWMRGRANKNLAHIIKAGVQPLIHPFKPSFLFENHLRPILPLAVKGVIWYQGESNAQINDCKRNALLLRTLISDWRHALQQEKLPFYIVQLPRIKDNGALRAHWAEFREVQQLIADEMEGVELICTLDLGQPNADVHPAGKLQVGERLAKLARYHLGDQNERGKASLLSPRIMSATWQGSTVTLKASAALRLLNGGARGLSYRASRKGEFIPVTAELQGDKIIVTLPTAPTSGAELRYNYSTYMEPNIVSADGALPLFPWRATKK